MKRGLVLLDNAEVPEAEWQRRVDAARRALAEQGVDLALVYGDVFRSDDIAYLTNLCIYWNEGMLAIPATGELALLTKLSPRVHTWMRRTSTLTDLRSGKAFGALVAELLGERPTGTLGLVDADLWPSALIEEVTEAAAGWTVRRLGGLIREQRRRPSPEQVELLRRAGAVLARAARDATAEGLSERDRVAAAEHAVRSEGFTDVLVRADARSVELTGQFRGSWLRVGRDVSGALSGALAGAVATATAGVTTEALRAAARAGLGDLSAKADLTVRVVDHADLSTDGEYAGPDGALLDGSAVAIGVRLDTPNGRLSASDSVLVGRAGAEPLTIEKDSAS